MCVSHRILKHAVGAIYVSKEFDQDYKISARIDVMPSCYVIIGMKNSTLDMVNDLQQAFHRMLVEQNWMNRAAKKAASKKVEEMLIQVAYPDFILDSKKLDNYYDNFSVEETDSYSQMAEKLGQWKIEFILKRLSKPVDRAEFLSDAAEVNAQYIFKSNTFEVSAAYLQAPLLPSLVSEVNIDQPDLLKRATTEGVLVQS
ncbi:hypothetical protein COOONC_08876 [Cooperia oncophora]